MVSKRTGISWSSGSQKKLHLKSQTRDPYFSILLPGTRASRACAQDPKYSLSFFIDTCTKSFFLLSNDEFEIEQSKTLANFIQRRNFSVDICRSTSYCKLFWTCFNAIVFHAIDNGREKKKPETSQH